MNELLKVSYDSDLDKRGERMKSYRIRKYSIAWIVLKTWKPATLLLIISLLLGLMVACSKAEAKQIEEPAEPVAIVIDELPEPETWDVPLEHDLQLFIADLCEEVNIDPELVLAMIEQESQWNPEAVGDGGRSLGLLQIQPRWHSARMDKLGCDDLLDPYQNVLVGIDILAEKMAKYDTIGEALTAYNAGDYGAYVHYFSKGIYANDYAKEVLARAEELKAGE